MTRYFSLLMLVGGLACASAGATGGSARNSMVITQDEIAASHEANAYDVVRQLRPNYLRSHGQSSVNSGGSDLPSIFVDGQFSGDVDALRNVIATTIKEIRYYSAPDAGTRFGTQYTSGVIAVTTR